MSLLVDYDKYDWRNLNTMNVAKQMRKTVLAVAVEVGQQHDRMSHEQLVALCASSTKSILGWHHFVLTICLIHCFSIHQLPHIIMQYQYYQFPSFICYSSFTCSSVVAIQQTDNGQACAIMWMMMIM